MCAPLDTGVPTTGEGAMAHVGAGSMTRLHLVGRMAFGLALIAALTACAIAKDPSAQLKSQGTQTQSKPDESCPWECVTWGESCVVDPRGVRKCMRECRDFRRVCGGD